MLSVVVRAWIVGAALFFVNLPANAERVGFEFSGMLLGSPKVVPLFGINVPGNSPVSGSFAYDTTVTGVDGSEPRSRNFPQNISGGFSLRIGTAIHLSASEYLVEVIDDFDNEEREFLDVFSVQFARHDETAARPVLLLNDEPFSGEGFMQVLFSWPSETFEGPLEPQLTNDRPISHEADRGSLGFVGEKGGQVFLVSDVSAVPPLAGDYNSDGVVDLDDFAEWKSTFGATGSGLPADGNVNEIVDAADYAVWRDNAQLSGTIEMGINQGIPEPMSLVAAVIAVALMFLRRGENALVFGQRVGRLR